MATMTKKNKAKVLGMANETDIRTDLKPFYTI